MRIGKNDVPHLTQLQNDYAKRDHELKCPQPPLNPGNTAAVFAAYQQKCCDLKTPLIDELMYKHNSYVSVGIREAQSNYRQYINGLISIVQLDPSPGNRRLVYATVAGYFTFIANAINTYVVLDPYMSCHNKLTTVEADEIISSAKSVDIECPSWLKMSVSLGVAKLKADCNGYNIEADIYKLIHRLAAKKISRQALPLYMQEQG